MADEYNSRAVEFVESASDEALEIDATQRFSEAVVYSTDWTTETVVNQMRRGNILLNPQFQRRDAWKIQHKSRFIESLVLGLPVPQLVLAEQKEARGKFIVLDGKQRLLSLLQFWGEGEGQNNGYPLSGLEVRKELNRKTFKQISSEPQYESYFDSLLNQSIRTVIIKNWPDTNFLHLVFLRLNTGSVKLSPQELRQAIVPGPFTTWIDETAVASEPLQVLLNLDHPDYRMRDVELLARYFSFRFFIKQYRGRMKEFLDFSFEKFNSGWDAYKKDCVTAAEDFDNGVRSLQELLGEKLARKPGIRQMNKAVFDFLIFYAQREDVRKIQYEFADDLKSLYSLLFEDREFLSSVERDTAGLPNTVKRIASWGSVLNSIGHLDVPIPKLVERDGEQRIEF